MQLLEIPEKKNLLRRESVYRCFYNIYEKRFIETSYHVEFPTEEVHEWLIENIGYETFCFRQLEVAQFKRPNVTQLTKQLEHESWDTINPAIPSDKRVWRMPKWHGQIAFARLDHATLFKLRWF